MAAGTMVGDVFVLNAETKDVIKLLSFHVADVSAVKFTADTSQIASA